MAAWWKFWASDEEEVEVLDGKGKKVKGGIPHAIKLLNDRITTLEKKAKETPVVPASVKKRKKVAPRVGSGSSY